MEISFSDRLRFWSKVDCTAGPDECWEWTASKFDTGYGAFWFRGSTDGAHRFVMSAFGHNINGLFVCHHCDNPPCVNPSHLFIGTPSDNVHDAMSKGRFTVRGSAHHLSKLTEADIPIIRQLGAKGMTHRAIAKKFGVAMSQIGFVINRKTWKHVT